MSVPENHQIMEFVKEAEIVGIFRQTILPQAKGGERAYALMRMRWQSKRVGTADGDENEEHLAAKAVRV
jgi:hypothetical protein